MVIRLVFDHIRQHGLKLNQSNCVILTTDLIHLGHKITLFQPNTSKMEAMLNPNKKEELQRFLGMSNN